MKILVTGAKGFVGKNLCAQLRNIRDGKARCYGDLCIEEIYEYDVDSTPEQLDEWCAGCDFVFNLAGVNRPNDPEEFMKGNFGFATTLLETLKKHGNKCPVMISSSIQASLEGRFANSEYGRSKKAGEELMFQYSEQTGAPVLVYRFPNLFGKWCRPNYNSAVATFCNNIANDLPITVNDPSVELELLYIDDLVEEMIAALQRREHRCTEATTHAPQSSNTAAQCTPTPQGSNTSTQGTPATLSEGHSYCYCPVTHKATLGRIVELLNQFAAQPSTLNIPSIPAGSFEKKLYSTFLSYLPASKAVTTLKMNVDARGSFTELLHLQDCGQVSINISKPGITKGEHWHHSKWEQFIVVSGHGLIQMRPENWAETPETAANRPENPVNTANRPENPANADGESYCTDTDSSNGRMIEFEVSGDKIQAVTMIPGWTHNIINLSQTEDLVTVMYCNETFDPQHPDTYFDPVAQD